MIVCTESISSRNEERNINWCCKMVPFHKQCFTCIKTKVENFFLNLAVGPMRKLNESLYKLLTKTISVVRL